MKHWSDCKRWETEEDCEGELHAICKLTHTTPPDNCPCDKFETRELVTTKS